MRARKRASKAVAATEEIDRQRRSADRGPSRLDGFCLRAHVRGDVVLLIGRRILTTMSAPPPGEPLSTWPEVGP